MNIKRLLFSSILTFTLILLPHSLVTADASHTLAAEVFSGSVVSFSEKKSIKNTTLSVTGPNGFHASATLNEGIPSLDLHNFGSPSDGVYAYEITASLANGGEQELVSASGSTINNGRGNSAVSIAYKRCSQRGHFHVKDGLITAFDEVSNTPVASNSITSNTSAR